MAISFMQRRDAGIYQFRERLPETLAGKPAPDHVKAAFPELLNTKTGCFKRELVRSLRVHNPKTAHAANHRVGLEVEEKLEAAVRLFAAPSPGPTVRSSRSISSDDLAGFEAEAFRLWLSQDQEHRETEDHRRVAQSKEERDAIGPDLVRVHDGLPWGMQPDAFALDGDRFKVDVEDYRKAFAKRDISITEAALKTALRSVASRWSDASLPCCAEQLRSGGSAPNSVGQAGYTESRNRTSRLRSAVQFHVGMQRSAFADTT